MQDKNTFNSQTQPINFSEKCKILFIHNAEWF